MAAALASGELEEVFDYHVVYGVLCKLCPYAEAGCEIQRVANQITHALAENRSRGMIVG